MGWAENSWRTATVKLRLSSQATPQQSSYASAVVVLFANRVVLAVLF